MKLWMVSTVSLLALGLSVAHHASAQQAQGATTPSALGAPVLGLTLDPAKSGAKLTVTSTAFKANGKIPDDFSQNGKGVSPPLSWTKGPAGTQTYVVLAEDAGGARIDPTIHWVAYDIPATVTSLPQALPTDAKLAAGGMQGLNVRKASGFMGPKPPMGVSHPYHFEVFAVDTKLGLDPAKADRTAVLGAMDGHVLASGELVANYASPQPAFNPKDLTGVWTQAGGAPPYTRIIPYLPEYAAIQKEHQDDIAQGRPYRHDEGACLPRGLIGMMTTAVYPLEIFQSADGKEIAINKETPTSLYRIHLDRDHKPADERFPHYFGDSVGHWEGDVLAVDTIDLGKEDTLDAQNPNSPALHVMQRLHRITYDTIENQVTLEDPKAWAKPFTVTVNYKKHDATLKNAFELDEAVCDNERDMVDAKGNAFVKGAAK